MKSRCQNSLCENNKVEMNCNDMVDYAGFKFCSRECRDQCINYGGKKPRHVGRVWKMGRNK